MKKFQLNESNISKLGVLLFLAFFSSWSLQAATDVCRIDEFKIKDKNGTPHLAMILKEEITHTGTISIALPPMRNEEKKSLKPEIKMHDPKSATISPASGVAQDFSNADKPVIYKVDCTNKKGKKLVYVYKVTLTAADE